MGRVTKFLLLFVTGQQLSTHFKKIKANEVGLFRDLLPWIIRLQENILSEWHFNKLFQILVSYIPKNEKELT